MKSNRWLWSITLLFYFSGCTAYSPVFLPGDEQPDSPPGSEMVRPGQVVRLTLTNGETVQGTVHELTEDAVVFGKPGNYGLDKIFFPFEDIIKIEVSKSSGLTKVVTITVVGVLALAMIGAVGLANSFRGFGG